MSASKNFDSLSPIQYTELIEFLKNHGVDDPEVQSKAITGIDGALMVFEVDKYFQGRSDISRRIERLKKVSRHLSEAKRSFRALSLHDGEQISANWLQSTEKRMPWFQGSVASGYSRRFLAVSCEMLSRAVSKQIDELSNKKAMPKLGRQADEALNDLCRRIYDLWYEASGQKPSISLNEASPNPPSPVVQLAFDVAKIGKAPKEYLTLAGIKKRLISVSKIENYRFGDYS